MMRHELIEIRLMWAELHEWNCGETLRQTSLPAYAVWLGVAGEVVARSAAGEWILKSGDILIYPVGAAREISVTQNARWVSLGLLASSLGCRNMLGIFSAPCVFRPAVPSHLWEIALALVRANNYFRDMANCENTLQRDGLLRAFFGALWSECATQSLDEIAGAQLPVWLSSALERLHATPSIAIAALAREVGISPAQLRRGFHQYLNTSPQNYARCKRLDAARMAIENTDLPIRRIAQRHGFADAASFSRTMKRAFGVSPLDLRRAARQPLV